MLLLLALGAATPVYAAAGTDPKEEAKAFLELYNSLYAGQSTVANEASWAASTQVGPSTEGARTAANQAYAAFVGDAAIIRQTRALLALRTELLPLQVRELESILLRAGDAPATLPEVVNARIAEESRLAAVQDGYVFCFGPRGADGACADGKDANDVDHVLLESRDLSERLRVWEASKEIGVPLKSGLVTLQKLRNQVAREMGYSSFFGLTSASYGMSSDEMITLLDGFNTDMAPLYGALHTWATRQLAARYGQPVPAGPVPAQWYPNRWAQEWSGLVTATDLDPYFVGRTPESIVKDAESFYTSMGFEPLPPVFWEKSDLYPVAAGQTRLKNAHASAWHMDMQKDVRSLMSVEADSQWFFTSHHELGHVYYYLSYARPGVPPTLREGANRAFHEGVGELISLAAGQVPYLQQRGILPAKVKIDPTQAMLASALEQTVAFIPWSAGVMTHFEYELYEKDLPPEQWQARWWALAGQYQKVAPPDAARLTDPNLCDACTKTHIVDDPGQYYDYAIATVIKYQLHEHIATKILKQDPHMCNYYGNKEVGAFLRGILEQGATRDWREVLKEATGEDLSTRAMVAYFAPLQGWLEKENKKPLPKVSKSR
ncbi:MAG: M2 family metallopeptidase [Pseudomonadota bacterium]|nr:M2 family metallopeptidase [Pseudomonadota bacterium]